MIAIAGGTGRLGTQLVTRLAGRGLQVRVITREPARGAHLAHLPIEIVKGDVRDKTTISSALEGVRTVVSAVHGFAGPGRVSPATVDREGNANLIDAAAALDVDVILVSLVGASPDHPMELFRAKHAAEQYLKASSARWTIVRATAFIEMWAEIMKKPIVFGRGENPINFVSVSDVAAAVEQAVIDPDLRGKAVDVGGPSNLTFNQLAELLQQTRGGPSKVHHVPRTVLRLMAPLSRQVRAAIAMDTIDLTFQAPPRDDRGEQPMTDAQTALNQAIGRR
jgi:uncharacterized protein YbjT (DUF2867 family)